MASADISYSTMFLDVPTDLEVGRYEAQEHRSLVDEYPDESTHSGDMPHLYNQDPYFTSEAVSKWQLKGKRNTRNLSKRSIDTTEGRGFFYGPYSEEKVCAFIRSSNFCK